MPCTCVHAYTCVSLWFQVCSKTKLRTSKFFTMENFSLFCRMKFYNRHKLFSVTFCLFLKCWTVVLRLSYKSTHWLWEGLEFSQTSRSVLFQFLTLLIGLVRLIFREDFGRLLLLFLQRDPSAPDLDESVQKENVKCVPRVGETEYL